MFYLVWGTKSDFCICRIFKTLSKSIRVVCPALFLVIQMIQVVLPILPGAVGCLGGVLIFGPVWGFVYNYIGISLGSILAFLLSKRYGRPFVRGIIGEKNYEKYIGWLEREKLLIRRLQLPFFFPLRRTICSATWPVLYPHVPEKICGNYFSGKAGFDFSLQFGSYGNYGSAEADFLRKREPML